MMETAENIDNGQVEAPAESQPDFGPVMDRLQTIEGNLGEMREWVQPRDPEPQEPADDEPDEPAFFDAQGNAYDAQGNPLGGTQQLPQQRFDELIDRAVERRIQEQVAPELERVRQERHDAQVDALLEQYPDLRKEEVAGKVVEAAKALAQRTGNPELWRDPEIIENMYLAEQARSRSAAEIPASDSQGVGLEGSGANPGAPEPNLAEQILQAHRGGNTGGFKFW